MKKRSAAMPRSGAETQTPVRDLSDELNVYLRMRARFALADLRLYEISEEFTALANLLQVRNVSPTTGLLPERLAVPTQADVDAAINEWCLSRELARRVWSTLSKAAKAKYYQAPIGEGTIH